MNCESISVTLPAGLLSRLRAEARALGVPLSWAVAAFVAASSGSCEPPSPLAA